MTQHTQGKWSIDANDRHMVTADNDGLFVAQCETFDRGAEVSAANARLIAASPLLLEALQAALDCIRNPTDETDLLEIQIENAIARATGK